MTRSAAPCDVRFDSMLSESVAEAREREQSAFNKAAATCVSSIVLYGAGNLGRKVLAGLRQNGIDALAFADANPALSGKKVEGLPVLSPQEAVRLHGHSAAFVVCVWHPAQRDGVERIMSHLAEMGASRVLPFVYLFWKYPETFLPYYSWELPSKYLSHRESIREAYESFGDEPSRVQFAADLELRLHGRFAGRPQPRSDKQYFPPELFRLSSDECLIDCGAYDGDTIKEFAVESGGKFRSLVAFEADPVNFSRLQDWVTTRPDLRDRVTLHQAAVGRAAGTLRFSATGASNASVSNNGEIEVTCVALDDALGDASPTMIKMDIEGSEPEALKGATRLIAAHKPILAICVYHVPEQLWSLPLWMKRAEPEASLFLRSHAVDGFDTVCYAIPVDRTIKN